MVMGALRPSLSGRSREDVALGREGEKANEARRKHEEKGGEFSCLFPVLWREEKEKKIKSEREKKARRKRLHGWVMDAAGDYYYSYDCDSLSAAHPPRPVIVRLHLNNPFALSLSLVSSTLNTRSYTLWLFIIYIGLARLSTSSIPPLYKYSPLPPLAVPPPASSIVLCLLCQRPT